MILHGLEGSIESRNINGLFHQLEQAGFTPVVMHFRGCSGRHNRYPRAYHSGDTADLAYIVQHIRQSREHYPHAVIGISLGGNVLLKWLGETGEACPVKRAVAISVPFRLNDAAVRLDRGLSRIYRRYLLSDLHKKYTSKFSQMASPLDVDVTRLNTFRLYDDQVTAPLHGFDGVDDYYTRSSSRQFLSSIRVPTRIIHASDDPFMFPETAPGSNELGDAVELLLTEHGGHAGFITRASNCKTAAGKYSGMGSGMICWSEVKTVEFLR